MRNRVWTNLTSAPFNSFEIILLPSFTKKEKKISLVFSKKSAGRGDMK
jgi:hypothetical protein